MGAFDYKLTYSLFYVLFVFMEMYTFLLAYHGAQ